MNKTDIPTEWLTPNWNAPDNVQAMMTTRQGGVSQTPFDSMNLGDHVEDNKQHVEQNRASLKARLNLPNEPLWLTQTHSTLIVNADIPHTAQLEADASVAHQQGSVCVVMTADCLPVLFCNQQGTAIAAAHAGWRGLHAGILEKTVQALNCPPQEIIAWLGVAISVRHFEVGAEVREAFMNVQPAAENAFVATSTKDKWMADMYYLARLRLEALGIKEITGGDDCSYENKEQFYSYRREAKTGRMASLIWLS